MTKCHFLGFNGELFNSKKLLTATKHRTAHGGILLEIKKLFL